MRPILRTVLLAPRTSAAAAGTPVDGLLDFETASAADFITVARLNAATKGGDVTWALSRDPLLFTKIGANNQTLGFNVNVGGVLYSGSGTRALNIDLDSGVVAAATPAYETFDATPTMTWGDVTLEWLFRIPTIFPRTGTDTDIDLVSINSGGNQAIFQIHQDGFGSEPIYVRSHGSGSPSRGTSFALAPNVWYRGSLRANKSAGLVELVVAIPDTTVIVGASRCPSALGDVENFKIQSYLTFTGGNIEVDNIVWNHTTAPLPIGPLTMVAPTVVAIQSGASGIDVSWDAVGTTFKVERNVNSAGWAILAAAQTANSYSDSGFSDGDSVQYRVTATVGSYVSSSGSSNTVVIVGSTSFIVSEALGGQLNSFTGYLGYQILIGASDLDVSALALWVVSGSSQVRELQVRDATGVVVATVNIDTSGAPVGFKNGAVSVVLSAGAGYYLLVSATNGGDSTYDSDTSATTTADASIVASVYSSSPTGVPVVNNPGNHLYGPLNFIYSVAP